MKIKLDEMTGDQLVEHFAAIAVQQDEALLWNKIATFNKLFRQMQEVKEELRSRPGDQRHCSFVSTITPTLKSD
jgi:hypothetical protein